MHAEPSDVSRRKILALFGIGAAGAGLIVLTGSTFTANARATPSAAAPTSALYPLRAGSPFARWTVHSVGPLERGAVDVVVRGEAGELFNVEVMAKDESPGALRAPGESKYFSVYVRNGGDGASGTLEGHGLAAMTLASIIERNEDRESAAAFLTLSERLGRFPDTLGAPGTVAL